MRLTIATVLAGLSASFACASALAEDSSPWGAPCVGQQVSSPFFQWGDEQPYTLVPGGTFEDQGFWTLAGGAAIVGGNEPFSVNDPSDRVSLLLVPGASATSKPMCVSLRHPTIRMFVRSLSGRFSFFRLQAIYKTTQGSLRTVTFAKLAATARWSPSPAMPYLVNVDVPLDGDGTTTVAFRLVGVSGVTMLDDVYVDPRAWF